MWGFADSYILIIHHRCEAEDLCAAKEMDSKQLWYAAYKGDGFLLCEEIYNHFTGCDRRIADIYKGQAAQEKKYMGEVRRWLLIIVTTINVSSIITI